MYSLQKMLFRVCFTSDSLTALAYQQRWVIRCLCQSFSTSRKSIMVVWQVKLFDVWCPNFLWCGANVVPYMEWENIVQFRLRGSSSPETHVLGTDWDFSAATLPASVQSKDSVTLWNWKDGFSRLWPFFTFPYCLPTSGFPVLERYWYCQVDLLTILLQRSQDLCHRQQAT